MAQNCKTPRCLSEAVPDGVFCQTHLDDLNRIKKELTDDPSLLFNKRSDVRLRGRQAPKRKPPTCKAVGCFEIRVPPALYCFDHRDLDGGEEA
jgi:hypothetical protein